MSDAILLFGLIGGLIGAAAVVALARTFWMKKHRDTRRTLTF